MSKEPRTTLSGKEARYILKQNNINLAWLAEQIGIKPQSFQSRLNATTFSVPYQLEINNITGKRIFDIDMAPSITETKGRIPVIDMRVRQHADTAIRQILDNLKETGDSHEPPETEN